MTAKYKIAIVGAGPAGCTLAHLLLQANMDVIIFEGEPTSNARSQGGSLDLHTESGIAAMKACGLYEEFEKHARYDGEAIAIANTRNKRYIEAGGASSKENTRGRPEIDRTILRDILANPLSEKGIIRWDHRLKSADANGTLHFFNSSTSSGFDLVVGAEGAWSKIRKVLTDEVPSYSGVSGFCGKIHNAAEEKPWIHKLVNNGSWFGIGEYRTLSCQQTGDGSVNASFWHACAEDWTKAYDLNDTASIREALHREYRNWAAEYHAVIDAMDLDSIEPRNLYQLPVGMTWENKPGFTMIGDAAHLMTPFGGEGVNCAMVDALELAATITKAAVAGAKGCDGLAPYISSFEKAMCKRITPVQDMTLFNQKTMYFSPGAPDSIIEKWVIRNLTYHAGWYVRIPATILVYTYFFYVKWRLG